MSDFPDGPPTAGLLRTAFNTLSVHIFDFIAASGYDDLRPAHGNVLEQFAYSDGLRLTDLAAGAGMTMQSMSELVDDLERKGYIERRPDPTDRRAKRIYVTEKGRENTRLSVQAVQNVEDRLLSALGRERYDELRAVLEAIITAEREDARKPESPR